MRVAIPHWQDRVSPVLDVAGRLLLVDIERGSEKSRVDIDLERESVQARARRIAQMGPEVLICGAVSRPLESALRLAGIEVISQICGEVDHVVTAFRTGQLGERHFWMPGYGGRYRRYRARYGRNREN